MSRQGVCVRRAISAKALAAVLLALAGTTAGGWEPPAGQGPAGQEPRVVAPVQPGDGQPAAAPVATVAPAVPGDDAEPAPAVKKLLEAPYLSDEERRAVRVFHGVWTPADIDTPAARAKVALLTGVVDESVFDAEGVDPLDRADAAVIRGDAELALSLTEGRTEARARRIGIEALMSLGRSAEALEATGPLLTALGTGQLSSADEIVEGVKALVVRARLAGGRADEFQAMNAVLAHVRDRIDRLYWPTQIAEARLLADKDNLPDADKATRAALALNPRAAEAWALRGEFAAQTFDMKTAEAIARRLDVLAQGKTSAYAGVVRARAALRTRDGAGALAALEPLLAAYPKHREGLAMRAAAYAASYDLASADRVVEQYEALAPTSPDAILETGRALSESRQYDEAAAYLRRAAERAPQWSVPLTELGLVLNQAGRDEDARDALRDAVRLDPFNVRAGNTLAMLENLLAFERIEGEHFVVFYRPDSQAKAGKSGKADLGNQVMAREMIPVLERIHATVTGPGPGGIDHEPARKTHINLMPDHASFAVRIAGMPQIHTIAAATGPVIAMEAPREGAGHQGTYDWARVVQHEYTHTVTLSRTKNRIPHWFTEASAVHLELSPWDYNAAQLVAAAFDADKLFDFEKINLAFVRPEKPTDRSQAYAQGRWMYDFMLERFGNRAPLDLMDQYAKGVTEADAFPIVLKVTREEFFEQFKAWAAQQLVEWGMVPPAGEPTVKELLSSAARPAPDAGAEQGPDENAEPRADTGTHPEHPDDAKGITPELVAVWLEQHPKHPDVLELAVVQALKAAGGKPDEAMIPLLERYAAARPVDPMPHKQLARLYLDGIGGGPDRAIPHLEYLDAREQYSPTYAAELARQYMARAGSNADAGAATRDWELALVKAVRATQIAPFDPDYRELAATVALRRKDFGAARQQLQALIELEPDRDIHKRRLEALEKLSTAK